MPIFEYKCPKCGETFDKLFRKSIVQVQSIQTAFRPVTCPRCCYYLCVRREIPSTFYSKMGDWRV